MQLASTLDTGSFISMIVASLGTNTSMYKMLISINFNNQIKHQIKKIQIKHTLSLLDYIVWNWNFLFQDHERSAIVDWFFCVQIFN